MKAKVALSVDKYKEEVMSKMTWMKKERRYGDRVANDITITMIKSNNPDRKIMQLIFRNGCETKISKTGYLMVGTYKNRCFFCQTNQDKYGYTRLCDAKRSWIYKHYKAGDIYDVTFWDHEVEIVEMQFEKIAD